MEEVCPKCGGETINGLVGSFWTELEKDGSIKGEWGEMQSNTEVGEWRLCGDCDHEWADELSEQKKLREEASGDLLTACKSSLDRFGRLNEIATTMREWGIQAVCQSAIEELQAAIAKAEGKEQG